MLETDMKFLKRFFAKIESPEEAEFILNFSAYILFLIGFLQSILFAFLLGSFRNFYMDVLLIFIFGLVIRFSRSRVSVILLCIYSLIILIGTTLTWFGIAAGGGNNIFLALFLLLLSIRTAQVNFQFHKLTDTKLVWKNIWVRHLIAIGFAFILFSSFFISFIMISKFLGITEMNSLHGEIIFESFPISYILLLLPGLPWAQKRRMYTVSETFS
ncbi:hypothetical protein EHQ81_18345 [Leptospira selangorensis]|uniref:Uncharacterized protein n=2 Tax=Leptospira selangorensis TaxID=2484982 RepID=A0A5F2C515_9LEPT|nr:hypothetical protein EHQ81_18345 [Leptospira selangorensis]TGM26813.1 hypothetical protein EHQ82_02065 [Leptospira selangorensis]